ncbi:copper resistance protein CopC [Nonomuraea antimicrobica]|uniref:Copper resistance protein CopC n=1 Tax=Nonomuraea antimicrobica TaxID=561173 RepID=A0ABP7CAT4_9ACTN
MTHFPTLVRRTLASAVGAAMVLLLTAPAALAHDRLKSSSPADNAKVESVETIELEFTARMTMPTIVLEGPDGERVPLGKPRTEGVKVFAEPEGELAAGRYRIAWRVVSSDGHPIQGEIRFTLTAPPSPSPSPSPSTTEPSPVPSETPPTASAPPASPAGAPVAAEQEGGGVPGWLWIAAGALVLGGVAIFFGGRRRTGSDSS